MAMNRRGFLARTIGAIAAYATAKDVLAEGPTSEVEIQYAADLDTNVEAIADTIKGVIAGPAHINIEAVHSAMRESYFEAGQEAIDAGVFLHIDPMTGTVRPANNNREIGFGFALRNAKPGEIVPVRWKP